MSNLLLKFVNLNINMFILGERLVRLGGWKGVTRVPHHALPPLKHWFQLAKPSGFVPVTILKSASFFSGTWQRHLLIVYFQNFLQNRNSSIFVCI